MRAVRIHPYSRGRRGTLTERTEQVRVHAEHVHGARILGSVDARAAVRGPHLAHTRRHGGGVLEELLTRCVPLRLFSSPTSSRITRRDLHAPLLAQAPSYRPRLHPRRYARPARHPRPPPVPHHARQPRDAAKSAGALSALFHSMGVAVGVRPPPNTRVPALSGTVFGLAALVTDPQFGAGVMYDILALAGAAPAVGERADVPRAVVRGGGTGQVCGVLGVLSSART
jgi:hypothetical protein